MRVVLDTNVIISGLNFRSPSLMMIRIPCDNPVIRLVTHFNDLCGWSSQPSYQVSARS